MLNSLKIQPGHPGGKYSPTVPGLCIEGPLFAGGLQDCNGKFLVLGVVSRGKPMIDHPTTKRLEHLRNTDEK